MLFSQKYYFHRKSFPKQPFADFYEYVYPACSFPQKKEKDSGTSAFQCILQKF